MVTKAFYTERPAALQYMPLPGAAGADLWMRKNIAEVEDPETGAVGYEADEAYMRTNASRAEIEADFEGWYARASEWQPAPKTTPAELRKVAYESRLMVEFPKESGKMVTFDEAAKMFNSYRAVGYSTTATYLQEQMVQAKRKIKEMFPDE